MIGDRDRLREALGRLDKQRASGSEPGAVDFATVVEDESLDLICAAARLVLDAGTAEGEVEAAVDAFVADRENARLPTYISKPSWRNHIQAVLTAAALWRQEHGAWKKLLDVHAFRAGAEAMRKACIQRIDGGSFLHDQAPTRLLANQVIEALRSLPLPTPKGEKT